MPPFASWRSRTKPASVSRRWRTIVYVPDRIDAKRRRAVGEQALEIQEAIGVEPVVVDVPGHVARRTVATAREAGSSLIVLGHRGVKRARALGSVSERVVHQARCSVLVVPPDGARTA